MPPPAPSLARATAHIHAFRERALKPVVSHLARSGTSLRALAEQQAFGSESAPTLTNPFLPWKNPVTGRWRPPAYSLRRQKELIKSARAAGVLDLLPPGLKCRATGAVVRPVGQKKDASTSDIPNASVEAKSQESEAATATSTQNTSSEAWSLPVTWEGAPPAPRPVQTAAARLYAGKKRMFKGHKWQRVRGKINLHRRNLMRDMAKRVTRYKNVSVPYFSYFSSLYQSNSDSTTLVAARTPSSLWQQSSRRNCHSRAERGFYQYSNTSVLMLHISQSSLNRANYRVCSVSELVYSMF
jgi:large subunit ribosomal protein L25